MTRINYCDPQMEKEIKELKRNGARIYCTASTSKKVYSPVRKATGQGISSYANAMYRKYGDDVAVEVWYVLGDDIKTYCTYHA